MMSAMALIDADLAHALEKGGSISGMEFYGKKVEQVREAKLLFFVSFGVSAYAQSLWKLFFIRKKPFFTSCPAGISFLHLAQFTIRIPHKYRSWPTVLRIEHNQTA